MLDIDFVFLNKFIHFITICIILFFTICFVNVDGIGMSIYVVTFDFVMDMRIAICDDDGVAIVTALALVLAPMLAPMLALVLVSVLV